MSCISEFTSISLTSLIASLISIHSSSLMMVALLKNESLNLISRFVFLMAFGDFGWSLVNMSYEAFLYAQGQDHQCNMNICVASLGLTQYFAMITVFATFFMGFLTFLALYFSEFYEKYLKPNVFWLFTTALIIVAGGFVSALILWDDLEIADGWCWPRQQPFLYFWNIPITIIFGTCLLLYILIIYEYFKLIKYLSLRGNQPKDSANVLLILSCYILAFFITWAFDLVEYFLYQNHDPNFWLKLTTAITVHSGGTFNFLVYGILDGGVENIFGSKALGFALFFIAPLWLPVAVFKLLVQEIVLRYNGRDRGSYSQLLDNVE